jgi:hypothetical protein
LFCHVCDKEDGEDGDNRVEAAIRVTQPLHVFGYESHIQEAIPEGLLGRDFQKPLGQVNADDLPARPHSLSRWDCGGSRSASNVENDHALPQFQPIDRTPANARPELERFVLIVISRGVVRRQRLQLGCVHVDRLDPEFTRMIQA